MALVQLNGFLLAAIQHHVLRTNEDGIALLLGTSRDHTSNIVTDGHESRHTSSQIITIESFVPVSGYAALAAARAASQSVVGWFAFRRNSPLNPSMRERSAHAELATLQTSRQPPLLFALFVISDHATEGNHTLDYKFMFLHPQGPVEGVPSQIANLDQSSHDGYLGLRHPSTTGAILGALLVSCGPEGALHTAEASAVLAAYGHITSSLARTIEVVTDTDATIWRLTREINALRGGESPSTPSTPALPGAANVAAWDRPNAAAPSIGPEPIRVDAVAAVDVVDAFAATAAIGAGKSTTTVRQAARRRLIDDGAVAGAHAPTRGGHAASTDDVVLVADSQEFKPFPVDVRRPDVVELQDDHSSTVGDSPRI